MRRIIQEHVQYELTPLEVRQAIFHWLWDKKDIFSKKPRTVELYEAGGALVTTLVTETSNELYPKPEPLDRDA